MIIGILVCLNLFSTILSVCTVFRPIYGWFIPEIVFCSITASAFIRMTQNLGTSEDRTTRYAFSGSYTTCYVALNAFWQLVKPLGIFGNFARDFCSVNYIRDGDQYE